MLAPVMLNSGRRHPYGFGWFVDTLDGQAVYQHGGSWQGFRTQFTRYEGRDLTVVALTNLGTADPAAVATRIAEAIEPSLVRPAPVPISDDSPTLTEYVRRILETVARGELKVADFEFVRATVVPRMSAAYGRLLGRLGPLQSLELLSETEEGDDRKRTYRARYRDGTVAVTVKIGPAGRLTGLTMSPEGE